MTRLASFLDKVANLVIVGLGVAALTLLYFRFSTTEHKDRSARSTTPVDPPRVGQTVDLGVKITPPGMLVVVVSKECGFCTESLPLVADLLKKSGLKAIFAFPAREDRASDYLKRFGIDVPRHYVWLGDQREIGVRVTPTTLLLDRRGRIVRSWEGRLTKERTQEIQTEVSRL